MLIDFCIPRDIRSWLFPIIRWRENLISKGFEVRIISRPQARQRVAADCVVLTDKYYRRKFSTNHEFFAGSKELISRDVEAIRAKGSSVIFFDLGASPACRWLWLLDHVDLVLKRQLFLDRGMYRTEHYINPWVPGDCRIADGREDVNVDRLRLGWNIGYWDYAGTNRIARKLGYLNSSFTSLTSPKTDREFITGFRGGVSGSRSFQRKALVDIISNRNPDKYIVGQPIKRRYYNQELRNMKVLVSPFGYGEICFRDFEAVVNGCGLIKPTMIHLDTFPDFFNEYETYIPCEWGLSDLPDLLDSIEKEESDYRKVAEKAQRKYRELYDSFDYFFLHFKELFESVY